jgi:hypothetical protein
MAAMEFILAAAAAAAVLMQWGRAGLAATQVQMVHLAEELQSMAMEEAVQETVKMVLMPQAVVEEQPEMVVMELASIYHLELEAAAEMPQRLASQEERGPEQPEEVEVNLLEEQEEFLAAEVQAILEVLEEQEDLEPEALAE